MDLRGRELGGDASGALTVTSEVALSFLLVCEGTSDPETITVLADRVACAEHDWLDGTIESIRQYVGAAPGERFVRWSDIDPICDREGVPRVHGLGYALGRRAATRALRLALKLAVRPAAVLLVHDSDGDHDGWRSSLEAARTDFESGERPPSFAVVLGIAHPEREAWVLAGFEPRTPEERARLEGLRSELGFNPCEQGFRLTSMLPSDKKDAKGTLNHLTTGERSRRDRERELTCVRETDLETLKARGKGIGLSDFLAELRDRLAPCFIKA